MAGLTMTAQGWTISEACQEFEAAGMPVDPRRFRIIVRNLPGLVRIGETRSGERGGRGQALYEIGQLQRLHAALAPWLARDDLPNPGGPDGS